MGAPGDKWNSLFENYLSFLAAYRGTVIRINDAIQVESEKKEFTYFIPGAKAPSPEMLKRFSTIQVAPWAHRPKNGFPDFAENGSMTYMSLGSSAVPPVVVPGLELRLLKDKADLYLFSNVQCTAFLETSDSYQEWAPFLHKANDSNFGSKDQFFYLALLEKKPVAAALALDAEDVIGFYAAATLPDIRKKGVGAAVIQRMIADAKARNPKAPITLQVSTNSYAEKYFAKLGFQAEFTTAMLGRTTPGS